MPYYTMFTAAGAHNYSVLLDGVRRTWSACRELRSDLWNTIYTVIGECQSAFCLLISGSRLLSTSCSVTLVLDLLLCVNNTSTDGELAEQRDIDSIAW